MLAALSCSWPTDVRSAASDEGTLFLQRKTYYFCVFPVRSVMLQYLRSAYVRSSQTGTSTRVVSIWSDAPVYRCYGDHFRVARHGAVQVDRSWRLRYNRTVMHECHCQLDTSITIRSCLRLAIRQCWQRLRRDSAALALLVLLALGICEPLACILHCTLIMSLSQQRADDVAGPQLMRMPDGSLMRMDTLMVAQSDRAPALTAGAGPLTFTTAVLHCATWRAPAVPVMLPLARAYHKMLLTVVIALGAMLLVQVLRSGPRLAPPLRTLPPPLPPPNPC